MLTVERVGLSLEDVKTYLRVSHDAEDALLEHLMATSVEMAQRLMNNDFTHVDADGSIVEDPVPHTVKTACLRLIATLYEHRDDATKIRSLGDLSVHLDKVPHDVRSMLAPFRRFPGL